MLTDFDDGAVDHHNGQDKPYVRPADSHHNVKKAVDILHALILSDLQRDEARRRRKMIYAPKTRS